VGAITFGAGAVVCKDRRHFRRGAVPDEDTLEQSHQFSEADEGCDNGRRLRRHLKLRFYDWKGQRMDIQTVD
jgi:hypothetical protein